MGTVLVSGMIGSDLRWTVFIIFFLLYLHMQCFSSFPKTLYRVQSKLPVALREYKEQLKRGRTSFDIKLSSRGYCVPMFGNVYHTPNGMTLLALGDDLRSVIESFRAIPSIYKVPKHTPVPNELILLHEHGDQYSLQVKGKRMRLKELNARLTNFLELLPCLTKEELLKEMEISRRCIDWILFYILISDQAPWVVHLTRVHASGGELKQVKHDDFPIPLFPACHWFVPCDDSSRSQK